MLSDKTFKKLKKITGKDHCSQAKEDRLCYSYDASNLNYMPDAVVFPQNADQISDILKLANLENFYVIPRGSGSGMTGGALAVNGGIVVAMNRFNSIKKIDTENLIAIAQPGVITGAFHKAVEKVNLFYPPDPSSSAFSTLGGNLAECAGGPRAVKYGVTRDYVLGVEFVLPNGDIINTGVQTAKGVVGYDLTRLIVGSEGTLGIITEMTLKLLPKPATIKTMTAVFDKMEQAASAVSQIIKQAVIPRTVEYIDNASIKCAENYIKAGLPVEAGAMLIIEVDGTLYETEHNINILEKLCIQLGATQTKIAKNKEESEKIWKARKSLSPALFMYGPDKINEDIVVPRSKIPAIVKKIDELRAETNLAMASFGHAGDGNIHFNIMLDKKDKTALKKAKYALNIVFDYTLELKGTISGEHGIGITKLPYIKKEISNTELCLMQNIKKMFDPNNILNPGKVFLMQK